MEKLSKTQVNILEIAKKEINEARMYDDFIDYYDNVIGIHYNNNYNTYSKFINRATPQELKRKIDNYENIKNGIVLTIANTKTLLKLEKLGYIKIIVNANKQCNGIDEVKILNY